MLPLKIKTLKFLFVSFLLLNSLDVFSIQTLYICREDGIRYTSISRAGTPISWDWRFEGGDIPTSILQNPPVVSYNTAGTFNTYVTTRFDNGQTFEDTFIIVVKDWPLANFNLPNDTGFCQGSAFSLTLNAVNNPEATYQWSTGATGSSITINNMGTYWVNVLIKSGNRTCDSVYKEITVSEYPNPNVNLGADRTMCQNQTIVLDAGPINNVSFLWQPTAQTTRSIITSVPGTYSVRVTTSFGCFAEDDIVLIDSCPHFVFIPNAFSPNTDLLNDIFNKVWNFTPTEYTFRILNRWGEILFETNDLNLGWNGLYKDKPVQQDIYVYDMIYFDTDKKWYQMRGTFYLVR